MRAWGLLLLVACGGKGGDSGDSGGFAWGTGGGVTGGGGVVRVAGWNVETLGAPSSAEYAAVRDILARLDADVVALSELDEREGDHLASLADELGYGWRLYPGSNPFGDLRNGLMARLPVTDSVQWTSADLSDDRAANDVTRLPVEVTVSVDGTPLRVIGVHLKSGFGDDDSFRRAVDATRAAQAAAAGGAVVVIGDINADVADEPDRPDPWTSVPSGMPGSFDLGADLEAALDGDGIRNTPFPIFAGVGLSPVDAAQLDGRTATRDSSERRIDYVLVGADTRARAEVYDSRDDDGTGIAQGAVLPDRDASIVASDHFAILVEVTL